MDEFGTDSSGSSNNPSITLNERGKRDVYMERFEDGSGFVFNAETPYGVKYLTKHAFDVYSNLLAEQGDLPLVDIFNGPLYKQFVQQGIATIVETPVILDNAHTRASKSAQRQFTVWFHIANACNLACRYCYIPDLEKAVSLPHKEKHLIDSDTISAATRTLFEFCKKSKFTTLHLKFAGGEPTLAGNKIREACEISQSLSAEFGIDITYSILTNGVFVEETIYDLIAKYRISVSISVDGFAEDHDSIRFTVPRSRPDNSLRAHKRVGTWQTVDRNIDRLLDSGVKPFLMCTLTRSNYRGVKQLVDYTVSKRLGIRFSLVRDLTSHKDTEFVTRLIEELPALYDWLGNEMPVDLPIDRFAKFAEWSPSAKKLSACGACRNSIAVDQAGNVASCQMRLDHSHGNVNREAFGDIFRRTQIAEENVLLSQPQLRNGPCGTCYWRYVLEDVRNILG
jgi:uncharacterized protein